MTQTTTPMTSADLARIERARLRDLDRMLKAGPAPAPNPPDPELAAFVARRRASRATRRDVR